MPTLPTPVEEKWHNQFRQFREDCLATYRNAPTYAPTKERLDRTRYYAPVPLSAANRDDGKAQGAREDVRDLEDIKTRVGGVHGKNRCSCVDFIDDLPFEQLYCKPCMDAGCHMDRAGMPCRVTGEPWKAREGGYFDKDGDQYGP